MRCAITLAPLLAATLSGCIYANVRMPLAYRSPTPADVAATPGADVEGRSCATAIVWLVAWGDSGYDAAVKVAKEKSGATWLADVKADTQYTNVVFGIYQRSCTRVTGRLASGPPAPPPAVALAPAIAPAAAPAEVRP